MLGDEYRMLYRQVAPTARRGRLEHACADVLKEMFPFVYRKLLRWHMEKMGTT
jgi:hypothetical protein